MLYESKHFIEWTAAEFPPEVATELVELQRQLALRESRWETESDDESKRIEVGKWAKLESMNVLQRSGLLDRK